MQVPYYSTLFFGIIVLCAMVPTLSAAEIVVESDQLIVKDFEDSIGLGAFSIVLGYDPAKTTVTEVTFIEPFAGATNIQTDKKTVRISGFTVQPQLTGDIPIAQVVYEGEGLFDVYVNTFVNAQGDPVATVHSAYSERIPDLPGTQPPGTQPTAQPTDSIQTSVTTQRPTTPPTTRTVPVDSEDTLASEDTLTPSQQTETPKTPGDVEHVASQTDSSGIPTQTAATKSPLTPAFSIFAIVIALFSLKRNL